MQKFYQEQMDFLSYHFAAPNAMNGNLIGGQTEDIA